MRNLITDYLGVHAQAMPLRAQRMKLIASNLGNADTPGYTAPDLDFDAALRHAQGQ
ncbi:flagellar basal body protein, partial [Salmonella enterica]|nr:flagellar basal body protein [Salmonella enterica]